MPALKTPVLGAAALLVAVGLLRSSPAEYAGAALDDALAVKAEVYAPQQLGAARAAAAAVSRAVAGGHTTDAWQRAIAAAVVSQQAAAVAQPLYQRAARDATAAHQAYEAGRSEVDRRAQALRTAVGAKLDQDATPDGLPRISPAEARARQTAGAALLVDVRASGPRAQGSPEGAFGAPPFILESTHFPTTLELILVADDDTGRALGVAAKALQARGISRIAVLDGGLAGWRQANLPVHSEAPVATEPPVVTAEELGARRSALIVDVRSTAMFVAGHIPGALHIDEAALLVEGKRSLAGRSVVLYGQDDSASRRAAQALQALGHRRTARLLGGLEAYALAGLELQAGPPPPLPAPGPLAPREAPVLTTTTLKASNHQRPGELEVHP